MDEPGGDLTVVLPTFRRPDALRRLLLGLADQADPGAPWDLVVVDNDPGGSAREMVAAVPDLPARYLVEPTSGAVAARNRGIREATGDVLVLVDDDVVPDRDWLRELVAPILAGDADLTGGRVTLDPTVPRPAWFDEPVVGAYLTNFDLGGDRARPLAAGEFVVTASAAVRRDLAVAAGGFAAGFGPRGNRQLVSDDVQFVRAVVAAGGRAWWVPAAHVVHELPPSRLRPRWVLQRAYLQGRSDWMVDRAEVAARRWRGARIAGGWLAGEARQRFAEGMHRPDVAFHLACDVARTVGRLAEAASWSRRP